MKNKQLTSNIFPTVALFVSWLIIIESNIRKVSAKENLIIWSVLFLIGFTCNHRIKLNKVQTTWLIFVSFTFLSTTLNALTYRTYNFSNLSEVLNNIAAFLYPLLAIYMICQSVNVKLFFKLYEWLISAFTVLGIVEYITHIQFYRFLISSVDAQNNFLKYGDVSLPDYRMTLIFYHPYYYSVILVIFLFSLLYFPYKNKVVEFIFFTLGLINLVLTQTRSSWISFIVGLTLFYFQKVKSKSTSRKKYLVTGLLLVVLICLFFPTLNNHLNGIFTNRFDSLADGGLSSSEGVRLGQWSLIQYLNSLPLKLFGGGTNFGIHMLRLHPINGWIVSIDNNYLMLFLDYGIIGILLYVIFIIFNIRGLKNANNSANKLIYLSILSMLISSYFFSIYKVSEINYLFFILVGLSQVKSKLGEKNGKIGFNYSSNL